MSEVKYYVKIKNIDGPIKVKEFDKCFEASFFSEGSIENRFNTSNNGQSYHGIPIVSPSAFGLKNPNGTVSSKIHKSMIDATPIEEITVYESTKINGSETATHSVTYTKTHLLSYQRGMGANFNDIRITIGCFSSLETAHFDIDNTGKTKKYLVRYDLQKSET